MNSKNGIIGVFIKSKLSRRRKKDLHNHMMVSSKLKSQSGNLGGGFSLIEVLFSLVIMVFCGVALLSLIPIGLKTQRESQIRREEFVRCRNYLDLFRIFVEERGDSDKALIDFCSSYHQNLKIEKIKAEHEGFRCYRFIVKQPEGDHSFTRWIYLPRRNI